jgi:hypothetical protein
MPCPEAAVWGGVLKRKLLALYGVAARHPAAGRVVRMLEPLISSYVRYAYRRIARRVARQIEDYVASGFTVRAIVGIDGSPSCGVASTIALRPALEDIMALDVSGLSVTEHDALVRRHRVAGRGVFIDELDHAVRARGLDVPLLAHDLFGELDSSSPGLPIVS